MLRPKNLDTILTEGIGKSVLSATRGILRDAIIDKLGDQGIRAEGFPVDEIVDQILEGKEEAFSWRDDDNNRTITFSFTEEEGQNLLSRMKDVADKRCNIDFFQKCADSAAESILQSLEKDWPEQKLREDSELSGFRKRIEMIWGRPIDHFRIMLTKSRELFMDQEKSLRKSKSKRGLYLREALLGIHARALRTATAVLVLLENGLADDAYARWRTLYELSVVAAFLSEHGEKAAEKYLMHEAVTLKKRLDNALSWGDKTIPKRQQSEIEGNYKAVISKYGNQFKKDYGWAVGFIGNEYPKFVDLEKSVKGKMIAPPYKESSLQVHGGRAGLVGLGSSDELTAIGHSNLGLEIPLMHSSLCLMQVTIIHLYHSPARDLVVFSFLKALDRKIHKQCKKVAKKLARAE